MTKTIKKPPNPPKKTTYIVKDVFKEQDPDKRNKNVVKIIKKHIKKSRCPDQGKQRHSLMKGAI